MIFRACQDSCLRKYWWASRAFVIDETVYTVPIDLPNHAILQMEKSYLLLLEKKYSVWFLPSTLKRLDESQVWEKSDVSELGYVVRYSLLSSEVE